MRRRIAAVALDIDGVLLRGGKTIPPAHQALTSLQKASIPFIFLTNGGGVKEEQKAHDLNYKFDNKFTIDQFILAHTPFKQYSNLHGNKRVLVIGKSDCLEVARSYGFNNVTNPSTLLHEDSDIFPCLKHTVVNSTSSTNKNNHTTNTESIIEAAFIYHDSENWGLDIQVLSDAIIGVRKNANNQIEYYQKIPIYNCNSDIVYMSTYARPRYTQGKLLIVILYEHPMLYIHINHIYQLIYMYIGAFVEALKHVIHTHTATKTSPGLTLNITNYGKPYNIQYEYAEKILLKQIEKIYNNNTSLQTDSNRIPCDLTQNYDPGTGTVIRTDLNLIDYYMIGDNPKADIRGARQRGGTWRSILVRTGVYNSHNHTNNSNTSINSSDNDPDDPADVVCDDVNDAVNYIIDKYR